MSKLIAFSCTFCKSRFHCFSEKQRLSKESSNIRVSDVDLHGRIRQLFWRRTRLKILMNPKHFKHLLDTQESNEGKKMIAFQTKNSENIMDFDCDLGGRNQPCSYGKIRSSYRVTSIFYGNNLAASGYHDSQARNKTNGFSSESSFRKGKFSIETLMG